MKALIIGFFSKPYMPYIRRYEKIFKKNNIEYEIVTFDRDSNGKFEKIGNTYLFKHKTGTNKLQLLWLSIRYRRLILKLLKKNNYDKLVVLTTMPGILICNKLFKKYKNKYIFDYRDYTYEKIGIFKKIVNKIIDNSYETFISSYGFKELFNSQNNIYISHNISNVDDAIEKCNEIKNKKNINIGFLGYIRYFSVNTKVIESLKTSNKYSLSYFGIPFDDCNLEKYCKENNINNVNFYGKYDDKDKRKIYESIDMINSIFSLDVEENRLSIPNRLYDAALFKKPIIVAKGTYMASVVDKYKLGIVIDPFNDNIVEKLDDYIKNFNACDFENQCNIFLNKIYEEEKQNNQLIKKFLDNEVNI